MPHTERLMTTQTHLAPNHIRAYRLRDPLLSFVFPWVWTLAGAQWLNTLVHRVPWDRCRIEQRYFPSIAAVKATNGTVPSFLDVQTPEAWYGEYVARVEALCGS